MKVLATGAVDKPSIVSLSMPSDYTGTGSFRYAVTIGDINGDYRNDLMAGEYVFLLNADGSANRTISVQASGPLIGRQNTLPTDLEDTMWTDVDGNGIGDVFHTRGVYLLGYGMGGYNDLHGIRYQSVDLISDEYQWVTETQAHQVDGTAYSTANSSITNRTITLNQTKCAEARAHVSLGKLHGNVSFSFDYSVERTGSTSEPVVVAIVAGDTLQSADVLANYTIPRDAKAGEEVTVTLRAYSMKATKDAWLIARTWADNSDFSCHPSYRIYNTKPT